MQLIYLPLSFLLIAPVLLSGCGKPAGKDGTTLETDSVPAPVEKIMAAVSADDSVGFASMVSYPLQRPYPLKDIETPEEMKSYYKTLVDDSLHNVMKKARHSDWSEAGWRGWTLDNGQYVWVGDSLYEVTYVSLREDSLRKALQAREIASLAPSLRKGWRPEFVMQDPDAGTLYRIDVDSAANTTGTDMDETDNAVNYRLIIYANRNEMRNAPKDVLRGKRIIEGSEGVVSYWFDSSATVADPDSAEVYIEAAAPDTGKPRIHRKRRKGGKRDSQDIDVKKVYWLDMLPTDTVSITATVSK